MSVYDIPADKYNELLAEALKQIEEFKMPEWAAFVKTSIARKRPPVEEDFWYNRAASILRQLYIHGVVGVGRLRTRYGGRKNRGVKPERFRKGSGKIIRVILQQAEAAGFVEKFSGKKTGRTLSEKGREFLENIKLNEKAKPESEVKPVEVKTKEIEETKVEEPITEKTVAESEKVKQVVEEKLEEKGE